MNQMRVRSFVEELDDGKDYSHILEAEKPVVLQQNEDSPVVASPPRDINVNNEEGGSKPRPVEDVQYLFTNDQNVNPDYFAELERMAEQQAELLGGEPIPVEESRPKSRFNTEVITVIDDESDNNNNIVIVDGYTLFVSNKWDRNQIRKSGAPATKPTNNNKSTDVVNTNTVPSPTTRPVQYNLSLYDVIVVDDDDEYAYQNKLIEEVLGTNSNNHVNSNGRHKVHDGPQKVTEKQANGVNGSSNVSQANGPASSHNNSVPKNNVNNNKSLFQFDNIIMDDE